MSIAGAVIVFSLLAVGQGAAEPSVAARAVVIQGPRVELGDIVDVSKFPKPLRVRAAHLPLATFRPGQSQIRISSRRLGERVRALMPALAPWFPDTAETMISVRLKATAETRKISIPAQGCMRVDAPLEADAVLAKSDLSAAPCLVGSPEAPFRYDRASGVARTTRALDQGETIAAAPRFALAEVRPGQRLFIKTHIGAVVVEREVEAIQPAPSGRALFAKASDGAVIAIPAPADEP